jgi:hypothetical protein
MKDQNTIETLKKMIRKQISETKDEKPKSMHEMALALTKAASDCLKIMHTLKSKSDMPSVKARGAVAMHIDALEQLFNDMWQSPLSYLDNTPDDVVAQRRSDLDGRASELDRLGMEPSQLSDHTVQESDEVCNPTHCAFCGANYDKALQPECPECKKAMKMESWAKKLRGKKK